MLVRKLFGFIGFVNEKLLRQTKQSTIGLGSNLSVVYANLRHIARGKFGSELKLQHPNDSFKFPLPNRFSCPADRDSSKQRLYMTIKQAIVGGTPPPDKSAYDDINNPKIQDRPLETISRIRLLKTARSEEI